jgi:hypothetical protein
VLSLSLIMIVGCQESEETQTGESPYLGGSLGVIAEFEPMGIDEAGIYSIFEGESFPIQVIIKNKGEYDLSPGKVKVNLYGILLSDFSGISSGEISNTGKIDKMSESNEEGGEEIVNFGQDVKYKPVVPGTFYDVNVFASYTYNYKTYAIVPKVCFKENLRDDRVCDIESSKDLFVSAAPIQVQSVEEKPAGVGLIELDFEIDNVGGGKSTLPGQEFSTQYNQLAYVIEPSSEASKWTCSSSGRENQARLVDGKATVRCKLNTPLEKDALYTKQIGLTLNYDYRDIIQETVRIQKSE